MESGELVGDDVDDRHRPRAARSSGRASGFVLDGFPAHGGAGEALDEIMATRAPLIVIDIQVPEAELVRRLADAADLRAVRGERPGRRDRRCAGHR